VLVETYLLTSCGLTPVTPSPALAGYIQVNSGRELTCFIGDVNVPLATTADFFAVTADQAQIVVAIQQAF
jgi:hypothetical protein